MKFDIRAKLLSAVGLVAVGSYTLATFLIVVDELFTLAFYCRTDWSKGWDSSTWCGYPFPWTGALYGYAPWEVAFVFIMGSIVMLCVGFYLLGGVVREIKK